MFLQLLCACSHGLSPFWSTQLPVLIAVSIFGPTQPYIVEPGHDRCKATKFQEQAATDFVWRLENRTNSKMELPMDRNGNWGEQEAYFEGLNKQNAKCSKENTAKIYAELGAQLVFKPSQVCKLHFDIAI